MTQSNYELTRKSNEQGQTIVDLHGELDSVKKTAAETDKYLRFFSTFAEFSLSAADLTFDKLKDDMNMVI